MRYCSLTHWTPMRLPGIPIQWIAELLTILCAGYLAKQLPSVLRYRGLFRLVPVPRVVSRGNSTGFSLKPVRSSAASRRYRIFALSWAPIPDGPPLHRRCLRHLLVASPWTPGENMTGHSPSGNCHRHYSAVHLRCPSVPGCRNQHVSDFGTDGLAQTASFSYAFHRATGTFREPSMLAAWLITPLFLSMSSSYRRGVLYSAVIGSVILLTGSLTGVAAILIGAMFGLVFVGGVGSGSFRVALRFALVLILGFAVFRGVAISHTVHRADLFGVLSDRVSFLSFTGDSPIPTGTRHIVWLLRHRSRCLVRDLEIAIYCCRVYLGVHSIASFVSMYLSVMYSVGIFGLALLVFCLVTPLVQIWFSPRFGVVGLSICGRRLRRLVGGVLWRRRRAHPYVCDYACCPAFSGK